MTQYNPLKVILSNSQLNKLRSGIKTGTEVTVILSSNLIRNFNDETSFTHKLLLTDTKDSKICKVFQMVHQLTQLSKMIQSGGVMTGTSGIDDFINFPFKIAKSYLKDLSNIDIKKINKIIGIIFS